MVLISRKGDMIKTICIHIFIFDINNCVLGDTCITIKMLSAQTNFMKKVLLNISHKTYFSGDKIVFILFSSLVELKIKDTVEPFFFQRQYHTLHTDNNENFQHPILITHHLKVRNMK